MDLHGRIDEHARLPRGKRELVGDRRPIGEQDIRGEHRLVGREVLLEVQLFFGNVGVTSQQRLPAGAVTFGVFGMGPHDDAVAAAQKLFQNTVDASVENAALLP